MIHSTLRLYETREVLKCVFIEEIDEKTCSTTDATDSEQIERNFFLKLYISSDLIYFWVKCLNATVPFFSWLER